MNGKFAAIPKEMLGDMRLEPLDIVVYAALDSFVDSDGSAWPSISTLAERAGVSRRTVTRSLPRLAGAGYIVRERRRKAGGQKAFDSTLYRMPFRCDGVVSENQKVVSDGDGVASDRPERLCPAGVEVMPERHSKYTHITIPNERDCAGAGNVSSALSPRSCLLESRIDAETIFETGDTGDKAAKAHTTEAESLFEELWERYPRKQSRGKAREAFMSLFPVSFSPEMMKRRLRAINDRFIAFDQEARKRLARGEERYIPYLHNWLAGEGFNDA